MARVKAARMFGDGGGSLRSNAARISRYIRTSSTCSSGSRFEAPLRTPQKRPPKCSILFRDYFTPHDQERISHADNDVGSGGPLLLPDQPGAHRDLLLQPTKDYTIYVIDRDNTGQYHADSDAFVGMIRLPRRRSRRHGVLERTRLLRHQRRSAPRLRDYKRTTCRK